MQKGSGTSDFHSDVPLPDIKRCFDNRFCVRCGSALFSGFFLGVLMLVASLRRAAAQYQISDRADDENNQADDLGLFEGTNHQAVGAEGFYEEPFH